MAKHCYNFDEKTYLAVQRAKPNAQRRLKGIVYYIAKLSKWTDQPEGKYARAKYFSSIEEADDYLDKEAEKNGWAEF